MRVVCVCSFLFDHARNASRQGGGEAQRSVYLFTSRGPWPREFLTLITARVSLFLVRAVLRKRPRHCPLGTPAAIQVH